MTCSAPASCKPREWPASCTKSRGEPRFGADSQPEGTAPTRRRQSEPPGSAAHRLLRRGAPASRGRGHRRGVHAASVRSPTPASPPKPAPPPTTWRSPPR
jgi:hypothetical protein